MPLPHPEDQRALERAMKSLEGQSFAQKVTNALGTPLSKALTMLPAGWNDKVQLATKAALTRALDVAVWSLKERKKGREVTASDRWHKVLSGVSGAVGGAFGLGALAVELPVSLVLMMRSIADIARSEGEDATIPETRLACMEVLALGGVSEVHDPRQSGYYAARFALATAVTEAAKFVAEKGLIEEGAPALVRLVGQIAGRLSLQVSEKAAAQAIPIIGAAGGAAVNLLFIDHFQDMARGHFTIRRLERTHGTEAVKLAYEELLQGKPSSRSSVKSLPA